MYKKRKILHFVKYYHRMYKRGHPICKNVYKRNMITIENDDAYLNNKIHHVMLTVALIVTHLSSLQKILKNFHHDTLTILTNCLSTQFFFLIQNTFPKKLTLVLLLMFNNRIKYKYSTRL